MALVIDNRREWKELNADKAAADETASLKNFATKEWVQESIKNFAGDRFWYFNMPAQTLILSSQSDKTIDGISTNIPASDIEFEYEESGKSTIIPSDTEAWKIHFVTGSNNAKYALCKQISTGAYIGKFYLNTSHGGSAGTAAINFITYRRTN